jgi:hypothetical protein
MRPTIEQPWAKPACGAKAYPWCFVGENLGGLCWRANFGFKGDREWLIAQSQDLASFNWLMLFLERVCDYSFCVLRDLLAKHPMQVFRVLSCYLPQQPSRVPAVCKHGLPVPLLEPPAEVHIVACAGVSCPQNRPLVLPLS